MEVVRQPKVFRQKTSRPHLRVMPRAKVVVPMVAMIQADWYQDVVADEVARLGAKGYKVVGLEKNWQGDITVTAEPALSR